MINTLPTGKVSSELKISTLVPVPKVQNPSGFQHFRSVNMLAMTEVLETAICNQLSNYLEVNRIMYAGQPGFRSQFCETAILLVVVTRY